MLRKGGLVLLIAGSVLAMANAPQKGPLLQEKAQPGWVFTARLPALSTDGPLEKFAAADLKSVFGKWLHQFTEQANKDEAEYKKHPIGLNLAYDFQSVPVREYASPTVVSVCMRTFFFTGGAHPMTVWGGYCYGMVDGKPKRLTLEDVLKPGVNWKTAIADPAYAQLAHKGAMWIWDGTLPDLTHDMVENFTLGPKGITLWFNPYDVGPYAQGYFTATVPASALKDEVRPGFL